MSEICKNCSTEILLNFCGNCGQKKAKRIDQNYIKDEIQYTVFHMNKGFLYSIKKILRAPGKTAREFIEGNRVNHYKPILLLFVVAGISAFLTNTLIHPEAILTEIYQQSGQKIPQFQIKFNTFIFKYQAIVMLLTVPFMAFFAWLAFKKWGYNYYENIVLTAFSLVSLQTLTILLVIPIQYLLKDNVTLFILIPTIVTMILMICVFIWFYLDLYSDKIPGDVILRLLLLGALMCVGLVLLLIIGILISFGYVTYFNIDPSSFT